jgi:uncharacterized protein (TIGR02757 family)
MLSAARATRLRAVLDPFVASFDAAGRVAFDPVEAPRSYAEPADQEVAGLLAAGLAYGRADLFKPKLFGVLREMGPSPAAFVRTFDPARDGHRFASFGYRFNLPADVGALLAGAGHVLRSHGSLGAFLGEQLQAKGELRPALATFARTIRERGAEAVADSMGPTRALEHLLADADKGGACKRLLLYVRWMVRRDAVDLGTWEGLVPRSSLLIPVDTHVLRVSRLLGLTARKEASWRTAEEITASLRRLDPDDPVKYDFALCHLGMSGMCPARRQQANCLRCPLRGECSAGRRFVALARA